ncbi:hypothetical protein ANCDUO_15753 [Ancylostoma duodenale]|uniref:ZP domain-containing protein n=1 Tax=Ancylostoma duodenale TaxID=51022 RepID=A0A0C2CW55_9BILA|nr:hypothetical protein ANCDUO_15753 [Ancylostoma duodenale]
MECTAHRVGGSGPPTAVTLIADGSRSLAEKHPIRVDHRLIVKARAADDFQKDSRAFPEVCLQPTIYLSGLGLLALSLAALALSLCVGAKRRSDSVEDLLSISQ